MYQILVYKTNKDFALGYRTEKKYYQAVDFEQSFLKIVTLVQEVFQEEEVTSEEIEDELRNTFETGSANKLKMRVKKRFSNGIDLEITSKNRRYLFQLKKYPVERGDE